MIYRLIFICFLFSSISFSHSNDDPWLIINKAANIGYCQDSIQFIKEYSQKKLGQISQRVDVLYGGSVNEKNVEEFTNNKFIDGVFMGRSCLKVSNFIKICKRII